MSEEIQRLVIDFVEKAEERYGKTLKVYEAVSVAPVLFNRHSTTYSYTAFVLKRVGWRVSGGMLMLQGDEFYYEISASRIIEFNKLEENKFEIFEQLADTCYRRTTLRFEEL